MIQLIYTSVTRLPLSGIDISRMLLQSRVNNAIDEITGVLLYRSDAFMQLLEGEEAAVNARFAKIAMDPRHCGVQILRRTAVSIRTFPDWPMGFVHFDKGHSHEPVGLADYFDKKGRPSAGVGESALRLLSEFRYGNWRRYVDRGYAPAIAR